MSNPFENKFKAVLLLVCCLAVTQTSYSQCVTTGAQNPTSATTVSFPGSGYSFSPASNIISSDNIFSVANALLAIGSTHTNYVKASGFNFSIPSTAAVCGIEVTVERSASNLSILGLLESYVNDYAARMVKNGTILSTNRATSAHWAGAKTISTYGGSSDLWGTTWMPSEINDANFGFAFSAYLHGFISGLVNVFPSARVDNITITVYYNDQTLLPVRFTDFNLSINKNNTITASWKAENADDNYEFLLQRSKDGISWQPVTGSSIQKDNIHSSIYYTTDNNPYSGKSYYRIQVNPKQGQSSYSETKTVVLNNYPSLMAYPNPCMQFIYVTAVEKSKPVIVLDETGRQVMLSKATGNELKLDLSGLKAGLYVLAVDNKRMKILKQ